MTYNQEETKKPKSFIRTRLGFLGTFLLVVTLGWVGYQIYQVSTYKHTTAKVLNVQTVRTSGGAGQTPSTTYRPTLRFKDHMGRFHTLSTPYSSAQFDFDSGDVIPVIYPADKPARFRVATFMAYWGMPTAALLFAGFIFFCAYKFNGPGANDSKPKDDAS